MPFVIRSGAGIDYAAEVNSYKQLSTISVSQSALFFHSYFDAESYGTGTPMLPVTATGGRIFWMRNDDNNKPFFIDKLWVNWNGGNTNHNRVVYIDIYFNDDVPSANNSVGGFGNLNKSSTNQAGATVYYWNGSGNGMTVTSGSPGFFFCCKQGVTVFEINGAIIIPNGKTASINARGEETGSVSINAMGYYVSPDKLYRS